jgi:hypothetical protein
MDFSIDYKLIVDKWNLVININEEPELLIPTPLDKTGIDLVLDEMVDFIEDAMWDVTNIVIQLSDEEEPLGIIVDLYKGEDDDDPISNTYWFDDYIVD